MAVLFEAAAERPKTVDRICGCPPGSTPGERFRDKRRIGARHAELRQLCFARPLHRLHRLVMALRKRGLPKSGRRLRSSITGAADRASSSQ